LRRAPHGIASRVLAKTVGGTCDLHQAFNLCLK
jgi:hypothetical protein